MKKVGFLFIIFLSTLTHLRAQEVNVNLGVQVGIPTNEFQDIVSNTVGIGLGGSILVNVAESPLNLGLSGGYMIYGKDSYDADVYIGGSSYLGDFARNNNIIHGSLIARIRPFFTDSPIVPYLDGMFGFKYLYTRTRLKVDFDDQEDFVQTNTEIYDWAWSYGGAAGLHIRLSEMVYLDLRMMYLKGSKAEYLRSEDTETDPDTGEVTFYTNESKTDMFLPHIGISFFIE